MKLTIFSLLVSVSLLAQQPGGRGGTPPPAPKNLKLPTTLPGDYSVVLMLTALA